jgi:hypothetical protein
LLAQIAAKALLRVCSVMQAAHLVNHRVQVLQVVLPTLLEAQLAAHQALAAWLVLRAHKAQLLGYRLRQDRQQAHHN